MVLDLIWPEGTNSTPLSNILLLKKNVYDMDKIHLPL